MMTTKLSVFLSILTLLFFSCSKNNDSKVVTPDPTSFSVSFNVKGNASMTNMKQGLLWIYKDGKFYDTTTIDSMTISKGLFTKTLPIGSYKIYGTTKDAKFLFINLNAYNSAPPVFNTNLPLTAKGILDSSMVKPNLTFSLRYVQRDSSAQAFYNYFICNGTPFNVNKGQHAVTLNFERLGGQLSVIIDDAWKYPNAFICISTGGFAYKYDFAQNKIIPMDGLNSYRDDHWSGMFKATNGKVTINQNLVDTSLSVYFFVKKDIADGAYYFDQISNVKISKNKRTILKGNYFDNLKDHSNSFKTTIVDDWDNHPNETDYYNK